MTNFEQFWCNFRQIFWQNGSIFSSGVSFSGVNLILEVVLNSSKIRNVVVIDNKNAGKTFV